MKKSFTVHDLPLSERPRERLIKLGAEALSAQEILALILGRGTRGESVMVIAQNLMREFGNLKGIANASIEELVKIKGIGQAKATQLKAALELSKRLETPFNESKKTVIKSPEDVVKLIKNELKDKKKEHFFVILLDTRNQYLGKDRVSVGSLDTSIVHPREALKPALTLSAASIILVHNHPSGDPEPSEEDIKLTKRLVEAAEIIGIDVLDHIIIGDQKYLSLKARNLF